MTIYNEPRPFDELSPDHPMVGDPCAICGDPIRAYQRPTLLVLDPPEDGERIAAATAAHWSCYRGASDE